jgi:hypothetical protein
MRTTKSPVVGILLGLVLVAACRGSDNKGTPDGPVGPGIDTGPAAIHIQDVQSDTMAPGAAVDLHGVIVVAVDKFGTKSGDMWIEEPGGGERSGVHVFNAPVAQVATLVPGDIIDLTGAIKSEFVLLSNGVPQDKTGRTTTELQPPKGGAITVTKTGTGAVPAAHVIDAIALDAMTPAERDAVYEKWEGVLVEIRNVRARAYPQGFGTKPYPDDAYKFNITDNLLVESTQTKLASVDGLTCFASIIGVEDYFFDWLLLPRSASDVVIGTGCAPVTTTPKTIPEIQAALPTDVVELNNVYVTGVSSGRTSFWVSTSPTAASTEGGYVFQSSTTLVLDAAIVPGVQVSVIGTVSEFNDDMAGGTLTEVQPLRITVAAGTPATLTPMTGLTVAMLLDAANAPMYESVLVTLDNVKISAIGASANGFIATAAQTVGPTATPFGIGTDIKQLAAADLGCYKTVTGFWTNLQGALATTKPNAYGFIVRDLGATGGTCL